MPLRVDMHIHTQRYSPCSSIDPKRLVAQAVRAGLDAAVITEHFRQWSQAELDELVSASGETGFVLLAGFEYTTLLGDLLVYGLTPVQAQFAPSGMTPEEAVKTFTEAGGVCVAAHPTRNGMGFDESLMELPVHAIEVCSVNLREHEQRLASRIAASVSIPSVANSDAHVLHDVGRYATIFDTPIQTMADLAAALRSGKKFAPAPLDQPLAGTP